MNIQKEYEAMTLQEQALFISHSGAALVDALYHDSNKSGLEAVIKNLELILDHARDCLDCLEFVSQGTDILSKVKLMLEYVAHNGITEDYVIELEDMASRAHDDLLASREKCGVEAIEEETKRHWQAVLRRHEELAASA